jgi:putative chitinase
MTAALNRKAFFDGIRKPLFGGSITESQVLGISAILDACPAALPTDPLAYCFATVHHETARTMQPIREYGFGKGKAYGKPAGPYKQIYAGRGLVQLTWLSGYQTATEKLHKLGILKLDEDLVRTPDLAMRPDIASAILFHGMIEGWFTGKKLSGYFGHGKSDPKGARAIINGTDKASLIAGYFTHYRAALTAAGHGAAAEPVEKPQAAPVPAPAPKKPVPVKKRAAPVAHVIHKAKAKR